METKVLEGKAIIGKEVKFTTNELRKMSQMCNKIVKVIESHLKNDKKKIYLDDDDLYRLNAIFMCILETESNIDETVFDKYERMTRELWEDKSSEADEDIDRNIRDLRCPNQVVFLTNSSY